MTEKDALLMLRSLTWPTLARNLGYEELKYILTFKKGASTTLIALWYKPASAASSSISPPLLRRLPLVVLDLHHICRAPLYIVSCRRCFWLPAGKA